jgi:hypothetical protein
LGNIHTSDWCEAKSNNARTTSIGPFDIIATHRTLEVCESRIQPGEDLDHRHPALACQAAAENLALTQREVEMRGKYVDVQIEQGRPTFWPHRIWDSAEPQMGEAESQNLKEIIDDAVCDAGSAKIRKVSNTQLGKKSQSKWTGRRNEPTVMPIDFTPFATDNEETEWEDF